MEGLYKENENAWKELLEGLVRRRINRPVLAIVDGNGGLRSALDLVWPGIKVQRCTVHKLRNLQTYCPKEVYLEVKDSFNEIIQATNFEAGKAAYGRFRGKWAQALLGRVPVCPGLVCEEALKSRMCDAASPSMKGALSVGDADPAPAPRTRSARSRDSARTSRPQVSTKRPLILIGCIPSEPLITVPARLKTHLRSAPDCTKCASRSPVNGVYIKPLAVGQEPRSMPDNETVASRPDLWSTRARAHLAAA